MQRLYEIWHLRDGIIDRRSESAFAFIYPPHHIPRSSCAALALNPCRFLFEGAPPDLLHVEGPGAEFVVVQWGSLFSDALFSEIPS